MLLSSWQSTGGKGRYSDDTKTDKKNGGARTVNSTDEVPQAVMLTGPSPTTSTEAGIAAPTVALSTPMQAMNTQQTLGQANNQQGLNQLINGQLGGQYFQGLNPLTQQLLNQAGTHFLRTSVF